MNPVTVPAELTTPPPESKPPKSEVEHMRDAVRLSFAITTLVMLGINIVPEVLIPNWVGSLLKSSAIVTGYPTVMLCMFIASLALATPFLVIQIISPDCSWRQCFTRWATYGHLLGGLAWAAMALLSDGLDKGAYGIVLWLNAILNLAFAFALGLSANHELLRDLNRGRM